MKKVNVKEGKAASDWVVATYCDYGKEEIKKIIKLSYSVETGKKAFEKIKKSFSNKGKWRCWQENKKGVVLNDTAQ
jgi:hypothetical protein